MRFTFIPIILCLLYLGFTYTDAKKNYPQDYFDPPVKTPLRLSGTFGELRRGHFHAGIDVKGYVGLPIYAVAEGYVARIKVQSRGYGQVLYIAHPNGYTSVYAHLDKFPEAIESYVKAAQYRKEEFEVELFPPKDLFVFEKGEKIGEMGLTGSSLGPHLHFEIRDTKKENAINPLLFGLKVPDTRKPRMHQLKIYELNDQLETVKDQTYSLTRSSAGGYRINKDVLEVGASKIGLGIKVYDHMNGVSNWNGVYGIEMLENDSLAYHFEISSFAFSETRYIHAHLDYEELVTKKSYINRCYLLPGNEFSSYKNLHDKGVITLTDKTKEIVIRARDVEGNIQELKLKVRKKPTQEKSTKPKHNYLLIHNEANLIDSKELYLFMEEGTLYENCYLDYEASEDGSSNFFSKVHHLGNYLIPIHQFFEIGIPVTRPIPDNKLEKAFVAYCDKYNNITNCGGKWVNGQLIAKVRQLGDYSIMLDETPPTITPIAFSSNMRGYSRIKFKIRDNIRTARNVSGLEYSAWIDDQWVLMEFDGKNRLLFHRFDGTLDRGKHHFKLVVTDAMGNSSIFERDFTI